MKNINFIRVISIIFLVLFISCSKEDNSQKDSEKQGVVNLNNIDEVRKVISTKWENPDKNSEFSSFEFSADGHYVVVMNNNTVNLTGRKGELVYFGTYEIRGKKIILSDLGIIDITLITGEQFSFSFEMNSTKEKKEIISIKNKNRISASSKTDILCKTWVLYDGELDFSHMKQEDIEKNKSVYGENWKEYMIKGEKELIGAEIFFSREGTYLASRGDRTILKYWRWENEETNMVDYSDNNWQYKFEGKSFFEIKKLTETNMEIQQTLRGIIIKSYLKSKK